MALREILEMCPLYNYMHYSLTRKMRLPFNFIGSDLLYRGAV